MWELRMMHALFAESPPPPPPHIRLSQLVMDSHLPNHESKRFKNCFSPSNAQQEARFRIDVSANNHIRAPHVTFVGILSPSVQGMAPLPRYPPGSLPLPSASSGLRGQLRCWLQTSSKQALGPPQQLHTCEQPASGRSVGVAQSTCSRARLESRSVPSLKGAALQAPGPSLQGAF